MSIWFLIWFLLSATLLYFFGWTLYVIHNQKKAWKLFASKKKLRYEAGKAAQAPQMDGVIEGYNFSFFPVEYELGDVRHNRKMTAIEITLKTEMPFDGFICSGQLVQLARTAELPHEIKPGHKDWDDQFAIFTDKIGSMNAYLTAERFKIILNWLKKENIWFLLGFRFDVFILRIDTPLPLDNAKKLNALVKKILKDISALEVEDVEKSMIKIASASTGVQPNLTIGKEKNGETHGLSLELENDDN